MKNMMVIVVVVLLQDIYDEWQESPQSKYFIGSIITVKKIKDTGKRYEDTEKRYEVVDGQQRLTSIVIFLAAFRMYIETHEFSDPIDAEAKNDYRGIIRDILLTTNRKDIKLHLQYDETTNYVKKLIFPNESIEYIKTPSVKNMIKAYDIACKFIREQIGSKDIWLFINYFLKNVQLLVVVDSTNFANSLKIFETINNTGVRLKGMDLVKNLIFMNVTDKQFQYVKEKWIKIRTNLEVCGEEQKPSRFLRYFIIARYYDQNVTLTEQNTYNWISSQDKGRKIIDYSKDPNGFVDEILWYSKLYSDLVIATTSYGVNDSEMVRKYTWLYNIGQLNSKSIRQHILVLLSIKKELMGSEQEKKSLINSVAEQIEKLLFWYQLSSVQPKDIEIKFQSLAKIVRTQNTKPSVLKVIREFYTKEIESMNKPSWDIINSWSHEKIRYFLLRVENFLRKDLSSSRPIPMDSQVSLEHIFPQTPLNNREPFANYSKSVNNLGNYTLLETNYNSSIAKENDVLSTQWFKKKSSVYKKSDYLITQILSQNRISSPRSNIDKFLAQFPPTVAWNNDAVKKRREMLIEYAEKIWK
jgi:uncharacterized protein with ParB-like and HNH nuclease domain